MHLWFFFSLIRGHLWNNLLSCSDFRAKCAWWSLSMVTISAITLMPSHRSFRTICLVFSLSWVLDVHGCPQRSSSTTSSRPPQNLSCHSKTRACDMHSSPQTSVIIRSHLVGVFFNFTNNFELMLCSISKLTIFTTRQKKHVYFKRYVTENWRRERIELSGVAYACSFVTVYHVVWLT